MSTPPVPANMTYAEVLTVLLNRSRKKKAERRNQEAREQGKQLMLKEAGENERTLGDRTPKNVNEPTTSTNLKKCRTSPASEISTGKRRKVEGPEGDRQEELLGLLRESLGILRRLEREIPTLGRIEGHLETMARDESRPVESKGMVEKRLAAMKNVIEMESAVVTLEAWLVEVTFLL